MLSVRLACVRHAASVRPEPGSNSLKNGIKTAVAASIFFRASLLMCTLACVVGVKPPTVIRVPNRCKKLTGCVSFFAFFTLFNFQGPRHPVFRDSFVILPHPFPNVNTFFQVFLTFFKKVSNTRKRAVLHRFSRARTRRKSGRIGRPRPESRFPAPRRFD